MTRRHLFSLLLLSGVTALAVPAQAQQRSGLEGLATPVADDRLGEMRGKYVSAGQVTYFGISMRTVWQDQAGITTAATFSLSLNLEGGVAGVPVVMVGWHRDGEPGTDVGAGGFGTAFDAPVPDASGALQTITVAGSDNRTFNGMEISISPAAGMVGTGGADIPLDASRGIGFADGDRLGFLLEPGNVGMVLTGQGGDRALQSFTGGEGLATQAIELGSDGHSIDNRMDISIGFDPQGLAGQVRSSVGLHSALALGN